MMETKRIAIYPGTFDPITYGHSDVIKRAAALFDQLIIGIVNNNNTKKIEFSLEERLFMAKREVERVGSANVEVQAFEGLLVDFAIKSNARAIIRGLRALSDFEYEFRMSYMNYKLNSGVETIFMPATEQGHYISSSFVKQIAKLGGDVSGFVSHEVAQMLRKKYAS
ncbi:MAG: pantetheine-phosphate adenylyltransferase [Proteobacteria bacterium]|nr:pantetheine-phosphate adenylyltransferase [Pseudomonadota bacterium]